MAFKSPVQPLCRSCGKPIAKRTKMHSVRGSEQPLRSKADAQKLTNERVIFLRYHTETDAYMKPTGKRRIWFFTTWDGESYVDEFFCTNNCAMRLAYACARVGKVLSGYKEAVEAGKA